MIGMAGLLALSLVVTFSDIESSSASELPEHGSCLERKGLQ